MKRLARRLGVLNAAPEREPTRRRQPVEAAAPPSLHHVGRPAAPQHHGPTTERRLVKARKPRRRSRQYLSLNSPAFTGIVVLVGFIAVTPLIAFSVFSPPSSVASHAGPEITGSVSPLTEAAAAKIARIQDPKQDKAATVVRSVPKADVAPGGPNRTSDINPPVYVPAAMQSSRNSAPAPAAEAPRGVVSMQVNVPEAGADAQRSAPVTEPPVAEPTELAAVRPEEAPTKSVAVERQVADPNSDWESGELAASEPDSEEIPASAEKPDGESAVGPDEESGSVEAEETDIAIAKPQPRPADLAKKALASTRTGSIRTDVRMRSRPSNRGKIMMVVPRGSKVEIIDCSGWCKVVYKGTRGYIYKRYIKGATS